MKKLLLFSLFISFNVLGQSVTIVPSTIEKQNSALDDIRIQSYATYPGIIGIRANGTVAMPTALVSGDIISQLGVRGYTGIGFSTSRANIRFKATQNWTNTANGTAITFETTPDNSTIRTERMVINQDGEIGIGTISPTANLDVVRGTAPDGTAIFRGTTHVSHFNYSTNEDTYIRGGKTASNVIINDVAGLGNVGIGTITPQEKLHVIGRIRASNLTGTGNRPVSADANGNIIISTGGIAFSAKKVGASNLSVLPTTSYIIPFVVEDYDYSSSFNNSTGEFTAPVSGVYHFDASILWGSSSVGSGESFMFLIVNGGFHENVTEPINLNKSCTTQINRDIQLTTGDVVRIEIFQNSATTQVITNTDYYARFSGHLVFRF